MTQFYDNLVDIERCEEPMSVDLDIPRWLAKEEARRGRRPTTLFTQITEHPGCQVLGNPYRRSALLAALGATESTWLSVMHDRLQKAAHPVCEIAPPWDVLSGLNALPILRHRPGDAGRYITSGVGVTQCPESGRVNLGVYRIQVCGEQRGRIFFDPRTDAYRHWKWCTTRGRPLPIAIFIGANPIYMLVAASRLPSEVSDYDIASQLLNTPVLVSGSPPVPADSSYVIRGLVTAELEYEGPFAEFKGYYVDKLLNPVLEVTSVVGCKQAVYPAIVTGNESGLTLMAMQNEYLLYTHLRSQGARIASISYPLSARAEFLAIVEADHPTLDLVIAAMEFDQRAKLVIATPNAERVWDCLASSGISAIKQGYVRKGVSYGDRVGIALDKAPTGTPVEY